MTEPTQDSAAAYAISLLVRYGFELRGYSAEEVVTQWLNDYEANWVRLAVIEALYQGRYKSISVEQILAVWKRRSQTLYHFNHEFERLICRKFPQNLAENSTSEVISTPDLQQLEYIERVAEISPASVLPVTPLFAANETSVKLDEGKQMANTQETTGVAEPPNLDNNATYQADWSRWEASKRPIDQFTPSQDGSEFYLKLKAVAQLSDDASTVTSDQ